MELGDVAPRDALFEYGQDALLEGYTDLVDALERAGAAPLKKYELVPAVLVRGAPGALLAAADGSKPTRVSSDAPMVLASGGSPTRGAGPQLSNADWALNLSWLHESLLEPDGSGVRIGLVDTAIDVNHPALLEARGRIRRHPPPAWAVHEKSGPFPHGHGTATCSLLVGRTPGGFALGWCPGASIEVFETVGNDGTAALSAVLHAVEELVLREDVDVLLVPLNFLPGEFVTRAGGQLLVTSEDPGKLLSAALSAATKEGTWVVIPSGNFGPELGTVGYDARDGGVFLAGAAGRLGWDGSAKPAFFSGRPGPAAGRELERPILLPGTEVLCAKPPGVRFGEGPAEGAFARASGTSFAAAFLAALLAVARGVTPDLAAGTAREALAAATDGGRRVVDVERYATTLGILHPVPPRLSRFYLQNLGWALALTLAILALLAVLRLA
ncbi:MAG: hypothetical protein Kow0069_06480 [Promethearchaeota archaeon]